MHSIIKDPLDLIYCNSSFIKGSRVLYDDFINNDILIDKGNVQTIDKIDSALGLKTILGEFYYSPSDKVMFKSANDFSENLYEVDRIDSLSQGDYILVMKAGSRLDLSLTVFDISSYLYLNVYDVSVVSKKLCSEIGVSKSFLMQALRVGVPDNEVFNLRLSQYIATRGYETIEEFKKNLFEENCKVLKKKIPIDKGFLSLIFLYLLGDYYYEQDDIIFNTERLKFKDNLMTFLNKYNLNYEIENELVTCSSSFLRELFLNNLGNLSILKDIHPKFNKYIVEFLLDQSFVTGNEISLRYLQDFLMSQNILSSVTAYDESEFILTILSSDMYIDIGIGYLLPILSIEKVEKPLLKFNLI